MGAVPRRHSAWLNNFMKMLAEVARERQAGGPLTFLEPEAIIPIRHRRPRELSAKA